MNLQRIINLKSTPTKINKIKEHENDSSEKVAYYASNQRIAAIPDSDSPSQITLEGISGMVIMNTKTMNIIKNE